MRSRKIKRGLAIVLATLMIVASFGSTAFAAKPAKSATIEVIEFQPLIYTAGSDSVSTQLIVRNDDGNLPQADATVVGASASIELVSSKRNATTYEMIYTKPVGYTDAGSDTVTVSVYNTEGTPTYETIDILIEAETPLQNLPPQNDTRPDITGTFETGTLATPVFGEWSDSDSTSFDVVRTWELDGVALGFNPDDGPLLLDAEWLESTLVLKEVATDSDGNSSEASSPAYEIIAPTVNQPPQNVTLPDITGTFETGTFATPVFGEWSDSDSASFDVVRTWELDGVELSANPDDGPLLLDAAWLGSTLVLKEVATDSDGNSSEATSPGYEIITPVTEDIIYVALGDSIATGTVAPTFPDNVSYIHDFRTYLQAQTGQTVILKDHSEDGDRSGHLLARLGGPSYDGVGTEQALIDDVVQADVITLSIGGNNLMYAAKYTTTIWFWTVDYYDFDNIDLVKAEAGRAAFESELPQIIKKIRGYNPTAEIILNDIYNPFNKSTDSANYAMVQGFLYQNGGGINDVIQNICGSTAGLERAQVYGAFEAYGQGDGKEDITYMYIDDTYLGFELRNPHPNSTGQGLIETAVENAYASIQ